VSTSPIKHNQPIYNRLKPAAAKVVIEPVEPVIGATKVTKEPRPAEPFNTPANRSLTPEQIQERTERRLQYIERLRGPDAQVERLLNELMLLKEKGYCDWNFRMVIAQVETALAQAYLAKSMERFVAAVVTK
jgi:hypothetical protein